MQSLIRVDDDVYAVVDDDLLILHKGSTTYESPILIATAFRTPRGEWRLLRLGCVDVGFAPDAEAATQRLLADWHRHDDANLQIANKTAPEPFLGYDNVRSALEAGGDIGHQTALALLQLALDTIDHMIEQRRPRHDLEPAVTKALPL